MQRKRTLVFVAVLMTVAMLGQPVAAQDTRLQQQTRALHRAAASTVPPAPARLNATQKRQFVAALAAQRRSVSSGASTRLQKGVLAVSKFPLPELRIMPRIPFLAKPKMVALFLSGAHHVLSYHEKAAGGYAAFGNTSNLEIWLDPKSAQPELYLVDYWIGVYTTMDMILHPVKQYHCLVNFLPVGSGAQTFHLNAGVQHLLAVIQTQTPSPGRCKLILIAPAKHSNWAFYAWEATRLD